MTNIHAEHDNDAKWPPFVNRDEELGQLRTLVENLVTNGQSSAVAIEGRFGMGKSELLRAFQKWLRREHHRIQLARTQCWSANGPNLAFVPIVELANALHAQSSRVGRALRAAAGGLAALGPGVLSTVAPGLEPIMTAGKELVRSSVKSGSSPVDGLWFYQQTYGLQVTQQLLEYVKRRPTVLIVDDLDSCDPSSLFVLDRVLHQLDDVQACVVMAYCPERITTEGETSKQIKQLLSKWSDERLLDRRTLAPLSRDAVGLLVSLTRDRDRQSGNTDSPWWGETDATERVMRDTNGHPAFVAAFLQEPPARTSFPDSWSQLVRRQLDALDETERELVEAAAIQGLAFDSATVAELTGSSHKVASQRLRAVADREQIIAHWPAMRWSRTDDTSHFVFQHVTYWQLTEQQFSSGTRAARHARVAEILRERIGQGASWHQRLEIARHLHHAGDSALAESSMLHRELACEIAETFSLSEAERLCETAIQDASALPDGHQREILLIEAIELQLALTEVRWRGQHRPAGGPDIDQLAADAEAAAVRLGDPAKLIRTTMLRGKTLMAVQGLQSGLFRLEKAVSLAREHGDPVLLFVALVEYGRQVSKRTLAEGKHQLLNAQQLLAETPELRDSDDPVVLHTRNLGEIQLGITLFDSGELSEALRQLDQSVARLRAQRRLAELPIALNYLAQVRAGLGDYPAAIETLYEARRLELPETGAQLTAGADRPDSGWHAYNTALLAHNMLLSDPQNAAGARVLRLVEDAWAETERTWLLNLVPIVRNLYAEILLLLADSENADGDDQLEMAERLATATVEETLQSGMVRSEIAAHSLLSRIKLRQGDLRDAVEKADRAMLVLNDVGPMPALRSEEVYYHSAVAMAAVGRSENAHDLLARARAEARRKATLVTNEAMRMRFLGGVALNRAIQDGTGVES